MKFKTAFDRGETTYNPLGSPTAPIYEYRIDKKTGKRISVEVGETNIYEKIQESFEASKLENIIKRCTGGDISVLADRSGTYIDLSEIPMNMIEIQNMILKSKQEFEKLPAEIKNKFDNSVEKYISEYGSETWAKNLNLIKEVTEIPKTEEIKSEVTSNE